MSVLSSDSSQRKSLEGRRSTQLAGVLFILYVDAYKQATWPKRQEACARQVQLYGYGRYLCITNTSIQSDREKTYKEWLSWGQTQEAR